MNDDCYETTPGQKSRSVARRIRSKELVRSEVELNAKKQTGQAFLACPVFVINGFFIHDFNFNGWAGSVTAPILTAKDVLLAISSSEIRWTSSSPLQL